MAAIINGAGLRVKECCKLRMQDVDFEARTIRISSRKGDKRSLTILPDLLAPALYRQIRWRAALHELDIAEGRGFVELPGRIAIGIPSG